MVLHTFESSSDLIAALGNRLAVIRKLDPLALRREVTKKFRTKLLRIYGAKCGYCVRAYPTIDLQTAHIIPLEIGGLTNNGNLIVLCKTCHRDFDSGQCSIKFMMQIANDWRN